MQVIEELITHAMHYKLIKDGTSPCQQYMQAIEVLITHAMHYKLMKDCSSMLDSKQVVDVGRKRASGIHRSNRAFDVRMGLRSGMCSAKCSSHER
jgi:hypothetical protein